MCVLLFPATHKLRHQIILIANVNLLILFCRLVHISSAFSYHYYHQIIPLLFQPQSDLIISRTRKKQSQRYLTKQQEYIPEEVKKERRKKEKGNYYG